MRTIRLRVAYDGTHYLGWQCQPHGPTIQAALELALLQLTRQPIEVVGAGRTDAGVHALGQVAHFQTDFPLSCHRLRLAIQGHLPRDIVVRDVEEVPADFHARFQAIRKRYRYVIDNNPLPLPFWQHTSIHVRNPLDVERMHEAAQELAGTHDFRSFESHWPNKATSVRTVQQVSVTLQDQAAIWQTAELQRGKEVAGEHRFVCLEISADGFLYNMVRCIAGTLLEVGRGKWGAADVRRILQGQDRRAAGSTAPARGLFLVQVDYPEG